MNEVRRVRNDKLRGHHCREGYARSLESKSVECHQESNVGNF